MGHFGHFILECISSRLWYVIENTEDQRKIIFITVLGEKNWFYDFFNLCGILDRVKIIHEPTQFKNITVPDESVHSWEEYTEKYPIVYKNISKNANIVCMGQEKYSKIYLSHSKWDASGPKCVGEDLFEEFFNKQGYIVLHTEELPLSKQIYLINNANEIFTTLGSLSHFAMFCRPGIKFVELLREYNDALDAQILINQASDVDWYVIDTSNNYLFARREQGVLNMHFTNEFKNFWQWEYGGEVQGDNVGKSEYDLQYIMEWTKYYSSKNTFEYIRNLSGFDFISRFSSELMGIELNPDDYKMPDVQGELKALRNIAICLDISLHVSNIGNVNSYDSQYIFEGHRIEAIILRLPTYFNRKDNDKLSYSVYIKGGGWKSVREGEWAGTSGKNLPIQAIAIEYSDEIFCPIYRIYDGKSWSRWYREGMKTTLVNHMEAITVILIDKTVYKN